MTFVMRSILTPEKLIEHAYHDIVIVTYGEPGMPEANLALECETCGMVIADAEREDENEAH